MARTENITVPDIGDFDEVDVIEVLVAPGDRVAVEDGLITLESDKASMDVPSPKAGVVKEVKVAAGAKVSEGDLIAVLEVDEATEGSEEPEEPRAEDGPSPAAAASEPPTEPVEPATSEPAEAEVATPPPRPPSRDGGAVGEAGAEPRLESGEPLRALDEPIDERAFSRAYASPAIRRFARELGVDLSHVRGSGRGGRILREDVQRYVGSRLSGAAGGAPGFALAPELPEVDFSQWGQVERRELTRVQLLTGRNTHRSWITVPHVTQHDEADVTELEAFRNGLAKEAEERGVKVTPIPFLIRAAVAALREFPRFNASLSADGEALVLKRYFHVGVAVDTEGGLVVPVVRDADRKGVFELAEEVADLASRARARKLKKEEMEGGCFTISNLGGVGGTGFTPIVNWPEVAILGVSRTVWRPVWEGEGFVPRQRMPLSLSYDHRVIDGAAAARFTRFLAVVLGDVRRLLL